MKVTCTYDFDVPDHMVQAAIDKQIGEGFVEVVRCAYCANYVKASDSYGECMLHYYCDGTHTSVGRNEFCSRGNKKQ